MQGWFALLRLRPTNRDTTKRARLGGIVSGTRRSRLTLVSACVMLESQYD